MKFHGGHAPCAAGLLIVLSLLPCLYTAVEAKSPADKALEGRLIYKNTHKREIWTLKTKSDDVYQLPGQPQDSLNYPIQPASIVSLTCVPDPTNSKLCVSVKSVAVARAAAPVKATGVVLKKLVMVVSLTGSCVRKSAEVADVEAAFQEPGGYFDFLSQCSYSNMTYDTSAFKVISTPVPCNAAITKRCNEDFIAAAALAVAKKQLGELTVASYPYYIYVIPDGLIDTCGWVGLAELPGYQTWYTPDKYGVFSKGTVMQETLHNFGIWHGWKNGVEYKDYSTAMGYGDSCPSAPELWRLGWATPLDTLSKANLPAQVYKPYLLPATTQGPDDVMIKIQPDWLGLSYIKNVYLALRVKAAGDVDLLPEFDHKINVHELGKNIDNTFRAPGDPHVSILGTIPAGGSMTLPAYKLVVKAGVMMGDTKITLRICRYNKSADDCKDMGPSPPPGKSLPPPPPPPKPSPPPPGGDYEPPPPYYEV